MTNPIRLKIKTVKMRIEDVRLRMPFKFGIATLTDIPMLMMRVTAEDHRGGSAIGYSCDALPALWFDKAPGKSINQKIDDQITMAQLAADEYLKKGVSLATPFELWWSVYPILKTQGAERGINALTAGFGSSFPERAMMDAACRIAGVSLFNALKENQFGIATGAVHRELAGFDLSSALPEKPLSKVWCRHTVGLGDPLRSGEIKPEDRIHDGLPQALEEDIDAYGLRYFKVKIDADRERNLARLRAMAEIMGEKCPAGYFVTLDGNEQIEILEDIAWLLGELCATTAGKKFCDAILFIEQPLSRDSAFAPEKNPAIRDLGAIKPLIIDESDNDLDSLLKARDAGYMGISVKNCKGILKAVLNKCLLARWKSGAPIGERKTFPAILSSEDLTNTGVVPLQEDLATLAALGIEHSERNGHHYFKGLSHLSEQERESALAAHPDLYERKAGTVALRIRNGLIQISSIQTPGFGYNCEVDFRRRQTIEKWKSLR